MTALWIVAVAALVIAVVAFAHARRTARKLAILEEQYWQLKFEHGELKAKLERSSRPRPLQLVQRVRLAARLAAQYAERRGSVELPALPQGTWRRLDEGLTLLRRYARGRSLASPALADLERRGSSLQLDVDAYLERLRAYVRRPPAPTFRARWRQACFTSHACASWTPSRPCAM